MADAGAETEAAPKNRGGRPRSFAPEAALDAALRTFWRRGYHRSSLEDLTAACGVSKPSLYAAFGDKAALFAAALDRYRDRYAAAEFAALAADGEGRAAVRGWLRTAAAGFSDPDRPPGCPVAAHVAGGDPEDDPAFGPAAAHDAAFHAAIRARLSAARSAGELPAEFPVGPLADHLHGTRHALAAAARSGRSERALRAMADAAMAAWPAGYQPGAQAPAVSRR